VNKKSLVFIPACEITWWMRIYAKYTKKAEAKSQGDNKAGNGQGVNRAKKRADEIYAQSEEFFMKPKHDCDDPHVSFKFTEFEQQVKHFGEVLVITAEQYHNHRGIDNDEYDLQTLVHIGLILFTAELKKWHSFDSKMFVECLSEKPLKDVFEGNVKITPSIPRKKEESA
tara:strand:+ start:106 stop:615 length:510 start_codon:yes stop_codon:yes gene_type:complete